MLVAEGVGFEPTVRSPAQQFSRLPQSASLAPLRVGSDRIIAGSLQENYNASDSLLASSSAISASINSSSAPSPTMAAIL